MSRWRKALIALSVSTAASAAFVVTSSIPSQAETSLVATYLCTGGISGAGVELEARMTPRVEAGRIDVGWDVSYKKPQQFGSPGFFPEGSSLHLEGVVDVSGAWNGQLKPRGDKAQGELMPGDVLELPEGLSDGAALDRGGTIRFKPAGLTLKFTPAEGEVMVNNNETSKIHYQGPWETVHTAPTYDDYLSDVQMVTGLDASAKLEFIGTKAAYIGRREQNLGAIEVRLDGSPVTSGLVYPGKDRSGKDMTGTETQEVLWESPQLTYGPHTIEIKNTESKLAYLDAFRVITGDVPEPPEHDKALCTLQDNPGALDVTVPGPTNTPTDEPTEDPDPNNPDPDDPGDDTPQEGDDVDSLGLGNVVIVPQGTSSSTSTPKSTGPTATNYYRAPQVLKTPSGGVETGVAPDDDGQPYGLMAGGMAVVLVSAGGGLLTRRRRAAHVGGVL